MHYVLGACLHVGQHVGLCFLSVSMLASASICVFLCMLVHPDACFCSHISVLVLIPAHVRAIISEHSCLHAFGVAVCLHS